MSVSHTRGTRRSATLEAVRVTDSFESTGTVGFDGKAPVAIPTVTGSRSLGTALTNLLNRLDDLGLIKNNTS